MCLATAYNINKDNSIILQYVSLIETDGNRITLTDVMGEKRVIEGTISMVDLTGGVVKINCPE